MILWRISNYADLLGIGAMEASARWHTAGRPLVYLAESPSSALLEILVHLEADEDNRPDSYRLLKTEVADDVASESASLSLLPPGWKGDKAVTRAIGDDWLERGATALLRVPSVISPETYNWILNPRHADARRAAIVHIDRPLYDSRLFRA
jgi:RES domain-containing protein